MKNNVMRIDNRILIAAILIAFPFVPGCRGGGGSSEGAERRYAWERDRAAIQTATDAVLCYGGSHHRTPYLWNEERLTPYVTCVDSTGRERWLFDGFIFLEFVDASRPDGATYAFETGNRNAPAAGKAQWTELLDYWFAEGNGFDALDRTVAAAAERIGEPSVKRRVIMMLPDPVIYRNYVDTTASTTYWGDIDGRRLDFRDTDDRMDACKWFIDSVRERFAAGNYSHVDLAGFYWIREIVTRPCDTEYSYHLTRSDLLVPRIADYLHALGYSWNWIPYYGSRGYDVWRQWGFDQVYLQPNYYWKEQNDMESVCNQIDTLGVGMEFEFEPTLLAARDGSDAFRERFRAYLRYAREKGIYGSRPFAYYHGTNGLYDLATSADAEDRALYAELCDFIVNNPLRTPDNKE